MGDWKATDHNEGTDVGDFFFIKLMQHKKADAWWWLQLSRYILKIVPNVMNYSHPFVSIKHACQKDITISYWSIWLHWLITVYIQKYCNSLSKAILLEIHRRLNPDKKWHNIECSLMLLATHIVLSVNTGHQTEYMDKWQMM